MSQRPSVEQLKGWFADAAPMSDLRDQLRQSPTTPIVLNTLRQVVPDLTTIEPLTYTKYREFEHTGSRPGYQNPYYRRRAQLTRALLEFIMGDESMRNYIHDFAWSLCEETSWVVPAHEEQGPDYWDIEPPIERTEPLGAHTSLTREPDNIDLFAAETGAALAETVYLVGDDLAPEVRQRIIQEIDRHIFKPYLAYARDHWWFKGALNWNGVCNGSIALAFLYLEHDIQTKAEALALALEGFAAYIATGFEADGGSIEGVGYWNYGLMYYTIVAERLREITRGELDLLAQPRLKAIAAYPPGMALVAPDRFINFGDALERQPIAVGIANRIAERTGVEQLKALFTPLDTFIGEHAGAKLPVTLRHAVWWDHTQPQPAYEPGDFYLPDVGVVKFVGTTANGQNMVVAAKSGHNDGHHSHTDVAQFLINVDGESLLPDAGRGLYSKAYFRRERYDNIFNNSYSHNVPRIDGQLQAAGPEFGGSQQYYGTITAHGADENTKYVTIAFEKAYAIPDLIGATRTLEFDTSSGVVTLTDIFAFPGQARSIEEAFCTWFPVEATAHGAIIKGEQNQLELTVLEPGGVTVTTEALDEACRANQFDETLNRIAIVLPAGATQFRMQITPLTYQRGATLP